MDLDLYFGQSFNFTHDHKLYYVSDDERIRYFFAGRYWILSWRGYDGLVSLS